MTSLKVVMKVDVNIMKTSRYILQHDVRCWLPSGIKRRGNICVDSGQMRMLGFMIVFNQYKNRLAKLMYEDKHLMKLSLKMFLYLLKKNQLNCRLLQASLILLM